MFTNGRNEHHLFLMTNHELTHLQGIWDCCFFTPSHRMLTGVKCKAPNAITDFVCYICICVHILQSKVPVLVFFMQKKYSYDHKGCFYLIKNTVIFWNILIFKNNGFLVCNGQAEFSTSLQCHMSFLYSDLLLN